MIKIIAGKFLDALITIVTGGVIYALFGDPVKKPVRNKKIIKKKGGRK